MLNVNSLDASKGAEFLLQTCLGINVLGFLWLLGALEAKIRI
jgi:hypothetical protein